MPIREGSGSHQIVREGRPRLLLRSLFVFGNRSVFDFFGVNDFGLGRQRFLSRATHRWVAVVSEELDVGERKSVLKVRGSLMAGKVLRDNRIRVRENIHPLPKKIVDSHRSWFSMIGGS